MTTRQRLLAVLVATVWGVNFVVTDVALRDTPPLLLTALRFAATALPLIAFVPRPTASARYVVAYGLAFGATKFGLLYTAMANGMPAGMASLVLQAQALFSVLLAAGVLGERMRPVQFGGVLVASAGIAALAVSRGGHATLVGFGLTVAAAGAWAVANVIVRASGERRPLSMLAYASLVPPLPLLALSGVVDGPTAVARALTHISPRTVLAVMFIAYVSTLLGFGVWSRLIRDVGVARVAPFSLLVPVVGIAASAVALGEPITPATVAASLAVLAGLGLVTRRRTAARPDATAVGATPAAHAPTPVRTPA